VVRVGTSMLQPRVAWQRLAHMQRVVWTQPEVAYAVWRMALLDQLELTVELLTDRHEGEPELPSNIIPFHPRQTPSRLFGLRAALCGGIGRLSTEWTRDLRRRNSRRMANTRTVKRIPTTEY
jgi:hypothetical protein